MRVCRRRKERYSGNRQNWSQASFFLAFRRRVGFDSTFESSKWRIIEDGTDMISWPRALGTRLKSNN